MRLTPVACFSLTVMLLVSQLVTIMGIHFQFEYSKFICQKQAMSSTVSYTLQYIIFCYVLFL